jgi:DNA-directed RNA polymerase specialized sigma24 family protein
LSNQEQYQLLLKNPQKLLSTHIYQQKIKYVVSKFVRNGTCSIEDAADLIQDINRIFVEKQMQYIQNGYQIESALLIAYFEKAVYNKCLDLVKSRHIQTQHQQEALSDLRFFSTGFANPEKSLINQEWLMAESHKINQYLRLMPKAQQKLMLLLKIYTRLILIEKDLKDYYQQITSQLLNQALAFFGIDYHQASDKTTFENICPIVNACEQKRNTSDAIRKWLEDRVKEMIQALNFNNKYTYDKESLKNLLKITLHSPFVEG